MSNNVRQISGKWKIPGLVEEVPGDLHIDDELRSVVLSFCAALGKEETHEPFPDRMKISDVCGKSVDGVSFVLGECYVTITRSMMDANGFRAYGSVTALYVFEGLEPPITDTPLEFTRASVDFGEIVGWARLSNFTSRDKESSGYVYSWNQIKSKMLPLGDGQDVFFGSKCIFPGGPGWRRELTLTQGVSTDFCYPMLTSFSKIASDIRRVREIISFATGKRVAPLSAEVEVVSFKGLKGAGVPQKKCKAKVHFGDQLVPDTSMPELMDYVYTLPELVRVARVHDNWGGLFDKIQPALELYLSPLVSDEKTVRVQFLSIMQGLELLHAISKGNNALSIIQEIEERYRVDGADFESDKKCLFGCGQFNDKTNVGLKLRLFDFLYHKEDWPFKYPFGLTFSEFLIKLKDSRDYYTHYNPAEVLKAFTEEELVDVNWFMKSIFKYHMLKYMGFDEQFAYVRMEYDTGGLCRLHNTPANEEEWENGPPPRP